MTVTCPVLCAWSRRFRDATGGGLAVGFALSVPLLAGAAAVTMSTLSWFNEKTQMQSAADASALHAVRELSVASQDTRRVSEVARQLTVARLGALAADATIAPTVDWQNSALSILIERPSPARFAGLLGIKKADISVSARARLVGSQRICLITLDPTKGKTLSMVKTSRLTANNCSVLVNSTDSQAISSKDSAFLSAQSICSGGGVEGSSSNYSPFPRRDCPPIRDPLVNRTPPPVGACSFTNHKVEGGLAVLRPGTYCGGLKITNNAIAKLEPGTYVIKGGKLIVDATATIEGTDVSFYFADSNAQFEFDKQTTVNLAAPSGGQLAGILFFEERSVAPGAKHMILSNNAHTLLGTIYLPRGILHVDAERPISNRAAYTIVVANQVEMVSGPELVLNSNYGATSVPVPSGVGPVTGQPQLEY